MPARLTIILLLLLFAPVAYAQKPDLQIRQRPLHGWGRFNVGSWKLVKVTTETFNNGVLASVSTREAKTTLLAVDDKGFTLRSEATVEVAGRRFTAEPQTRRLTYFGTGEGAKTTRLADVELTINGVKIPCQVQQVAVDDKGEKRLNRFYFNPTIAPFLLKQESKTTDGEGKHLAQINVDVVAVDMPHKILAQQLPSAYVRTIHSKPDTVAISVELYCEKIPGGVVTQSMKIRNKAGQIIERRTSELVDYGVAQAKAGQAAVSKSPPRRRLFRRNRPEE